MTTEQMHYDERDLRAIEASGRLDANEGIFFARQLEYIRPKTYDVKRAQLNAIALMPVDISTNPGAEFITYRQYDQVGIAKIIANYADDLPRADVTGKEFTSPVRGIGDSYGYSVQEIRAAQYTGTDLSSKKQAAARRAHDELINKLAWFGDATSGLPGLLSNVNIPGYTVPAVGTGTSKLWTTKTPDQIIADMNGIVNQVTTQSKGIHKANQLWLPLAQYTYIGSVPRSATSDTTILEFFKMNNPGVEVKPVLELAGAKAGPLDTMMALENSIDNFQLNLAMLFLQHAPQQRGLEFVIPCESRFAGVTVEYPLSMAIADSI